MPDSMFPTYSAEIAPGATLASAMAPAMAAFPMSLEGHAGQDAKVPGRSVSRHADTRGGWRAAEHSHDSQGSARET